MKKLLLVSALALTCAAFVTPRANAQTAQFTFTPATFERAPGQTLTFSINLVVSGLSGGNPAAAGVQDIQGLTYFLQVNSGAPFFFSITGRDIGASPFTDLISTNAQLTSTGDTAGAAGQDNLLNPSNDRDAGALADAPMGNGTYFIANITLSIANNAAPGTYTIQSVTTGGQTAVFNDSNGDTAPIQPGSFTVTVVPEPSTYALLAFGVIGAGIFVYRRRATA